VTRIDLHNDDPQISRHPKNVVAMETWREEFVHSPRETDIDDSIQVFHWNN